ncbi:sulfotransferase family 2 domain-containing protein [Roseixanthobacter glucoisosaccharinicivorans]|uniref:sulfotransferase family 2 domain-containing protein n=1 Tax=Roseixanthobacter glucoisosaccharinicivorans TaxID=3119923 RepID=UPI0037292B1F
MTGVELVSVHVPKCAGTSLRLALQRAYGEAEVLGDYADGVLNPAAAMNIDPDRFFARWAAADWTRFPYRAVHGHFHPNKYRTLPARVRATFLRDPLTRLISHYHFWRRAGEPGQNPVRDYMYEQNLSLEDFAHLPSMRYFYTGFFFRDVDMASFDVIGFYETAAQDMARLEKALGVTLDLGRENTNTAPEYARAIEELRSDPAQTGRLRALLSADIAFYETLRERAAG